MSLCGSLGYLLFSLSLIPHLKKDIAELEKVQRRAERMAKGGEGFLSERKLWKSSGLESFSLDKMVL